MESPPPPPGRHAAHRIVASYALAGGLWIYGSDRGLSRIIDDPALLTRVSIFKGLLFIVLTASLLYALIKRHVARSEAYLGRLVADEERFLTIFNSMSDALFLVDAKEERIININQAVCGLFDCDREAALGLKFHELCHGEPSCSREEVSTRIRRAAAGDSQLFDWCRPGKEGGLLWTEVSMRRAAIDGRELVVVAVRDIDERKDAERRIAQLALHDPLTNLANRQGLHLGLCRALEQARSSRLPLAIVFLDLDRFKTINDSLGHDIGDLLLFEVASRLREAAGSDDIVARHGGDEFVVVLSGIASGIDAVHGVEKILDAVSRPYRLKEFTLHTTPSIGISIFPNDGLTAPVLLKHADTAMYHAKALGRNNYQFFTRQMQVAAHDRLELEKDLRLALEREEFVLHYQPQMEAATGRVVGVEALVRWRHPRRGMLAPDQFIAMAEETGLILDLGNKILAMACNQLAAWLTVGIAPVRMAVNLSARQFRQVQLPRMVADNIARTGIPPHLLELEITESAAMDHPEATIRMLADLRAMGVGLAIDDFGTGYSSLSYLKLFPVDRLKIDRSFVKEIGSNSDDEAIASAIIKLAHTLGKDVVAEGVETEEQCAFLKELGCNCLQGYLYSRPLPAAQALEFLLKAGPGAGLFRRGGAAGLPVAGAGRTRAIAGLRHRPGHGIRSGEQAPV